MKSLVKLLALAIIMVACAPVKTVKMEKNSALIVVDMLYDFIDGSLACQNAEQAVAYTQTLMTENPETPALFICDHHPADHSSFTDFGGIWPVHCVAGTRGGEVHEALKPKMEEALTFYKGCVKEEEQYSGFEGKNEAGQTLAEVLEMLDAQTVYLCGIATEYCVYNTAKDLKNAGFNVVVIEKGLAYVAQEGHVETLSKMREEGFKIQ